MKNKILRKIIEIDENKCDGCGLCVPACAEGAIRIVEGKARLVGEAHCDGLGACLGECPRGAITIVERITEPFSEIAAQHDHHACDCEAEPLPCGCPSATVTAIERESCDVTPSEARRSSMLGHWPVQLALVPPAAHFLKGCNLLLAADCVPFAYDGFHRDFLKDNSVLVACPKLDDYHARLGKLTAILREADVKGITVVRMEVPCCSGLTSMAKQAINNCHREIPLKEIIIGIDGGIREDETIRRSSG